MDFQQIVAEYEADQRSGADSSVKKLGVRRAKKMASEHSCVRALKGRAAELDKQRLALLRLAASVEAHLCSEFMEHGEGFQPVLAEVMFAVESRAGSMGAADIEGNADVLV